MLKPDSYRAGFFRIWLASMQIMRFSKELTTEYREEMSVAYGVVVSEEEAQVQLLSLIRTMFPSVTLQRADGNEVGASITPTSGHKDKNL